MRVSAAAAAAANLLGTMGAATQLGAEGPYRHELILSAAPSGLRGET